MRGAGSKASLQPLLSLCFSLLVTCSVTESLCVSGCPCSQLSPGLGFSSPGSVLTVLGFTLLHPFSLPGDDPGLSLHYQEV